MKIGPYNSTFRHNGEHYTIMELRDCTRNEVLLLGPFRVIGKVRKEYGGVMAWVHYGKNESIRAGGKLE